MTRRASAPDPRKRRLPDPPDPDDPKRAVDPAPLAGLLESLASRKGWAEPVRLHGGVLVLRVDSPAWATQVRYLTGGLAKRANEVLGEGSVQRITLVTGPLQGFRS